MSAGAVAVQRPAGSAAARLDRLTSLRFFAALAVVAYHAVAAFWPDHPRLVLLTSSGFTGVTFFYVLSGFVLTWSWRGQRRRDFYRNRVARVWPLHALTLLVAVLLGERAGAGATVANALLLHAWVPDPSWYFGLNGVSWSLSCEAFFYASFPVLVVLLSRTRSWHWLLVPPTLSAIVLLGSTRLSDGTATWLLYLSPPYRMLDFVMGILLALLVRRGAAPRVRLDVALGLLVVGPLLLVATGRGITRELYGSPIIGLYDLAVLPGVCALLLAAAGLDAARTPGWLNRRPLVWLGECSFALYMTHQLVFSTVSRTLDNRPAAGLLGLLLVVPVSALAHHLVERPLERRWRVQKTPGSQRGDAARTAASTVDGPDDSGHETGGPGAMVRR